MSGCTPAKARAVLASPTPVSPELARSPDRSDDIHDMDAGKSGQEGQQQPLSPEAVPGLVHRRLGGPQLRINTGTPVRGAARSGEDFKAPEAYLQCTKCHPEFATENAAFDERTHTCPARRVVQATVPAGGGKTKVCCICNIALRSSADTKNALRAKLSRAASFCMLLCEACRGLLTLQDEGKPMVKFEGEAELFLACWHSRHCVPLSQFDSCTEMMCTECKAKKYQAMRVEYTPSQIEQCEAKRLGVLTLKLLPRLAKPMSATPRLWFRSTETLVLTWDAKPTGTDLVLDVGAATGAGFLAHLKAQPVGQTTLVDVWDVNPGIDMPESTDYVLGHIEFCRQAEPGEAAALNARHLASGAATPGTRRTPSKQRAGSEATTPSAKRQKKQNRPPAVPVEQGGAAAPDATVADATNDAALAYVGTIENCPAELCTNHWYRNDDSANSEDEESDVASDDDGN